MEVARREALARDAAQPLLRVLPSSFMGAAAGAPPARRQRLSSESAVRDALLQLAATRDSEERDALLLAFSAALQTRELKPVWLLGGVAAALRSEATPDKDEELLRALCDCVDLLDAALVRAGGASAPPIVGGGRPGGLSDALIAVLRGEALHGANCSSATAACAALLQRVRGAAAENAASEGRSLYYELYTHSGGAQRAAAALLLDVWPGVV